MPATLGDAVERELLVCCSRTNIDRRTRQRIETLLARCLDWDRFLNLARAHQVMPLVGAALGSSHHLHALPPPVIQQISTQARELAVRGLLSATKLQEIVDRFQRVSIPVIPYKGPLLSVIAYGQLGLRQFSDLDVWVHPWDYRFRVPQMLLENGWSLVSDFGFERSFRHAREQTTLDVHHSLTHARLMPFSLRFGKAYRRGAEVALAGRTLRTLCPVDLLLVLCMQLAKDTAEERRGPPLIKVCDIAELVRSQANLEWNTVIVEARRSGALKVVCLGLAVARKLLGTRIPPAVVEESRTMSDLDTLVRHVEERIFGRAGGTCSRPELLDAATWNAAVRERLRDRNKVLITLDQYVLEPNDYDYDFVRLPKALFPMYRVVRPFRLAWKLCRTMVRKLL